MNSLLIKHDSKLLATREDSDGLKNEVPIVNELAEPKMPELTEDATLQRLLTLDCQWLLKDLSV